VLVAEYEFHSHLKTGKMKNSQLGKEETLHEPAYGPPAALLFCQHSLQYTGLPSVGLKGTSHSAPQSAQTALYICLGPLLPNLPYAIFLFS
jgi:hypothetical protein